MGQEIGSEIKMTIGLRYAQISDIKAVGDLDYEAFNPYGTVENQETFHRRRIAFPHGFVVMELDGEIAAYGCSEKWLADRDPGLGEDPIKTHHAGGKIFCITGMAVRMKYRGKGYGLAVLDKLIEIAHQEGCTKIILETTHAQGLYFKRGFRIVRSREERGIRLDVMALDLD